MKKLFILLAVLSIAFAGCKDDDPVITPNVLRHDGPNQDAPLFDPGEHEAATRFSRGFLTEHQGKFIDEIEFYIEDEPDFCEILIYEGGSANGPLDLIYSFDFTSEVRRSSWNRHLLDSPLEILDEELWISIYTDASTPRRIIGCDSGPADGNGDWLYTEFDNEWRTFRSRTNGNVSVNWNIRANLSE